MEQRARLGAAVLALSALMTGCHVLLETRVSGSPIEAGDELWLAYGDARLDSPAQAHR
jgi:hypothetical protein